MPANIHRMSAQQVKSTLIHTQLHTHPYSFTHSPILNYTLIHTHSHTHPYSFTHSSILIHPPIHTHLHTHLYSFAHSSILIHTLSWSSNSSKKQSFHSGKLERIEKVPKILLMTQKSKVIIPLMFIKVWFIYHTKNQLRSGLVKKYSLAGSATWLNTGYKAVATWRGKIPQRW